jgi:hypothetical protein
MDNILVIMDVWFGSTHKQIYVKFEMWGLGYPAYHPRNLLQSMTSNFSPFPIIFDNLLPSLSSATHLTFTLYLLLPSHDQDCIYARPSARTAHQPASPIRPPCLPNKEISNIFEHIWVYSRYFLRIFREYVQYAWFIPGVMGRHVCPPTCYTCP